VSDAAFDDGSGAPEQNWLQLVDELIGQTEEAADPVARAALLCRAAEIYERRLADPDNAVVALQAAFRADPSSGRVVQELERLARANGKWAEVIASTAEVIEGLEGEVDPKQIADLWVQIAFWFDNGLERLEDAATAARHALFIDATHGGALTLLEDIYRRQRSWDRFVEVLAKKWENPYRDHYKIAEAYAEALKLEPEHQGLLEGMARLCEETNQWERAAETLRRLTEVAGSEEKVSIHYRLGAILQARLGDPRAAEEHFVQALALDPAQAHVPSMLALIEIYQGRGDWMKAAQLTLRVAESAAEPAEKVRLTFQAATIFHHRLDDQTQAAGLYAAAMTLEPQHPGTAEPLSEIYFQRGDWAALAAIGAPVEASAEAAPPAARAALLHRLGRAAQMTGDEATAVTFYGRSAAADGAYLPTLKDWAALAFARKEWGEAARLYDAVLLQSQDDGRQSRRDEAQEIYHRLGTSQLQLGDAAAAIGYLERALSLDGRHRPTVEALAEAHARVGDVEALVRQKQLLLTLTDDREAKLALYQEIAEIYWSGATGAGGAGAAGAGGAAASSSGDQRRDAQRAIAAYFAALALKPEARPLLHRLLDLLTETKQWKQAVQILLRLAELEEGTARAPYLVAAANIYNYELGSAEEALPLYDRALDRDPDDLKTFERVDKMLTATKDWKNLERSYRKQITRMGLVGAEPPPEKRPAMLALWSGLGEIYRSRINDYAGAIAAFEVCVAMEPEVLSRRVILAELYQLNGAATYEKAVAEHRHLLKRAREIGEMVPHLKVLLRLFIELVQFDSAWCVAQLLVLLGRADGDERQLYEQYRPKGVVRARARLTEELWQKHLYHPEEDRAISQLLALVGPCVAMARAKEHKEWGLKRKERRDLATDPLLVTKVLGYVGQVLGVPVPEVYVLPDAPGGIDLANARAGAALAPSLVIGKEMLQTPGPSETETAFLAARQLAMLRPDHFLRWPAVVPTVAELQIVVLAAIRLVNADFAVPDELRAPVAKYGEFLGKLASPQLFEQLEMLVGRFAAARSEVTIADLTRWSRAVYLTVTRAGLLICNELEVAARLGQVGAAASGALEAAEVVRDLVEFSISEEYFVLRRHLGMGLG
jgi:tetratricopeptide (TPR) repeat protein